MSKIKHKSTNEIDKKCDMSTHDYLSPQLNKFLSEDFNPKLEELLNSLKIYKKSLEASINKGKSIKNEEFKHALYTSLESLLCQTSYLKSKNSRESKINTIHQWFIEKRNLFTALPEPIPIKDEKEDIFDVLPEQIADLRLDQLINEQKEKILVNKINNNITLEQPRLIKSRNYEYDNCYHSMDYIKNYSDSSCMNSYSKKRAKNIMVKPLLKYELLKLDNQLETQRKYNLSNMRTIGELSDRTNNITMERAMMKGKCVNKYEKEKLVKFYQGIILKEKEKEIADEKEKAKLALEERLSFAQNNKFLAKRNKYSFHISRNKLINNQTSKDISHCTNQFNEPKSLLITQSSQILRNNEIKEIEEPKVEKVTIDKNCIKQESFNEKIFTINTRIFPSFIKQNILKNMKYKDDPIPNDCYIQLQYHDPIFLTRASMKDPLNVNEIDNSKKNIYNSNPLSGFAFENITSYDKKKDKENKEIIPHYSKDKVKFAKNNYPILKENLLQLRKSMSTLNEIEINALKNNHFNLNESIKTAFINPTEDFMPIGYLPRNGSGLLFQSNKIH